MKENETKKFDENAYKAAYNKNHYKQMKVDLKPEVVDKILNYCKDMNISKAKFVQLACLYVIDNDLFSEIAQEKWEREQRRRRRAGEDQRTKFIVCNYDINS